METITKKTVTNLTDKSVSILTQQFEVEIVTETRYETTTEIQYKTEIQLQDGVEVEVPVEVEVQVPVEIEVEKETQVGSNHRCAYSNTENGRAMFIANEPEDIVSEVLAVWGDEPTVEEPELPEIEVKPTQEERITELEEQLNASDEAVVALYEMQANQSEINDAQDEAITGLYELLL